MLAVLLRARELLCRDGWARGEFLVDGKGAPKERQPGDPWTLNEAVMESEVSTARWSARLLVSKLAGAISLPAWNAFPYRTARDVQQLLDACIRELGMIPPHHRIRDHRAPKPRGWRVSCGPGGVH